jgi:iron complex outermembrane receptor protein
MSSKTWVLRMVVAFLVPLSLAARSSAESATDVGPQSSQLQEVVVTAQKRTERLQDVPLAVSVLSGDTLQQMGAQSFQDYLTGVAGVSYFTNRPTTNLIFIRGVSGGVNIGSASTTGIYIDEAPVSQAIGGTVDLNPFDLDRVEILKGPQGTLYGASSMGGTVRLIMNKPNLDKFDASFDGSGSYTDLANYSANGMVNIPLIANTLGLRITAGYRDMSGFINDPYLALHNINSDEQVNLRGQLRWKPSEQADVLLSFAYSREQYAFNQNAFVGAGIGPHEADYVFPDSGVQPFNLSGLTVNYDFDFAKLTSATNYSEKFSRVASDITFFAPAFVVTPGPGQGIGFYASYDAKTFTQELRLASKKGGRFNWLVGAYYESGTPPNLGAHFASNIPALEGLDLYTSQDSGEQHQRAAFGEVSYEVWRSLTVTAGVRESHYDLHTPTLQTGLLNGGDSLSYSNARSEFTDKKYAINYQLSPDHLLYAQAASGSRPGVDSGVSGLPPNCLSELPALGYPTPPKLANPDNLWTYEVGSKNALDDRRVTLNADAYYTRWRDVQSIINLSCGFSFNGNAGAARIRGVELEANLRPIDPLLLSLSVALTDSQITQSNASLGALAGDPLPLVPKYNGSASARYDFPVFAGATGYVRGDVTYVDGELSDFAARSDAYPVSAYVLANLRLGFLKDNCEVSLFATNLANRRIVTYEGDSPLAETLLRPRTIGINFKWHL